jgi:TldD protein
MQKVSTGISEEYGAVLIADSTGRLVEDLQPMTQLYLTCVAEQDGKREQNGYNVAGREDFSFYSQDRLDRVVREAVARTMILFEAVPARRRMPVVMGAARAASCCTRRSATAWRPTSTARARRSTPTRSASRREALRQHRRRRHDRPRARGDQRRRRGQRGGKTMLVEDGILTTYLHDSISAKHYGVEPTGNGRRESYQHVPMPRMRSTYMLPGPHKPRRDHREREEGHLLRELLQRPGEDRPGRFHLLREERLPDRGRQAHPPHQGREHHRQRTQGAREDRHGRDDLKIDEGGWTCGKDGQSVPVSQGMPTVRVSAITVGGRTEKRG